MKFPHEDGIIGRVFPWMEANGISQSIIQITLLGRPSLELGDKTGRPAPRREMGPDTIFFYKQLLTAR